MKNAPIRRTLGLLGFCLAAFLPFSLSAAQNTSAADVATINLNTASESEILSIPGTGDRMLREFLEYRPYSNITGFQVELGKYVGDAQIAEWEQYVFVPTDPNTATVAQLTALKGIDEATAQAIIAGRSYAAWQALETVLLKTYDQATVNALKPY